MHQVHHSNPACPNVRKKEKWGLVFPRLDRTWIVRVNLLPLKWVPGGSLASILFQGRVCSSRHPSSFSFRKICILLRYSLIRCILAEVPLVPHFKRKTRPLLLRKFEWKRLFSPSPPLSHVHNQGEPMTLFFFLQRPGSGGGGRRKKRSFQAQNFCPFQIGGPLFGGKGPARRRRRPSRKLEGGKVEAMFANCRFSSSLLLLFPVHEEAI